MTKKLILSTGMGVLMAGLLLAQGPGDAPRFKGKGPNGQGKMPPPPGMMGGPGSVLDGPNAEQRLASVLGLTAEQQNKVHTALEEQKVQTKGLGDMVALRNQLG